VFQICGRDKITVFEENLMATIQENVRIGETVSCQRWL
jgi:hypothetical protein